MAKQSGARVIVAQHWMYLEVTGKRYDEQAVIEKTASDAGAEVIQLGPGFRAAIDRGENPYRDYIHPSPIGQRVIAEKLAEAINPSKPAASTPSPASPQR
jgi:lysophospholipase L1-like esterase